jgi:antitoxin MazE
MSTKAQIVRIRNSQGIRVPKPFLQREGWGESFRQMASKCDDRLLDEKLLKQTRWDEKEWQW